MSRLIMISFVLVTACGGAEQGTDPTSASKPESLEESEASYTAQDLVPRAVIVRADLTTAVDAKRYRATAPIASEFTATEPVIYLVGRLKRVPTDSTIEVHWFLDAFAKPLLISHVQGSDSYQFVASFRPTERKFVRGSYTARVFVGDLEVGGRSFVIRDKEIESKGSRVRRVQLSKKVTSKMKAVRPTTKFKKDAKRICVSFGVTGVDHGVVAEVQWLRGDEIFHSEDVTLDGDKRYATNIHSMMGLPNGSYEVKILILNKVLAKKSFQIGKSSTGTAIDALELGLELRANNMPVKSKRAFKRDTPVIQCGLRFLDLPPNTVIEIQWIQIEEDGDVVRYMNRSNFASGGSGTMGAAWEPTHELDPGEYKTIVVINGEAMAEEEFKIE
ncbi:MAG: hypothetical protein GY847_19475 [Proteobacteria bacterium]|nr:hypothetical protein [Pseudomonadota bacterium]